MPGNVLNFYSPYRNQQQYLENQMSSPYFPATFEGTASVKNYYNIESALNTPLKLEDDLEISIYNGGQAHYPFYISLE